MWTDDIIQVFSFYVCSLPKTSGIKMIDTWLIFSLFIPFAEVVLHTLLVLMKQRLEEKGVMRQTDNGWVKEKVPSKDIKKIRFFPFLILFHYLDLTLSFRCLQNFTLYGLPILFFAFLCIFFAVGLTLVYSK